MDCTSRGFEIDGHLVQINVYTPTDEADTNRPWATLTKPAGPTLLVAEEIGSTWVCQFESRKYGFIRSTCSDPFVLLGACFMDSHFINREVPS